MSGKPLLHHQVFRTPGLHREVQPLPSRSNDVSQQDLAQVIPDEVRQAVANESPENQRAKKEAIVEANTLNSPENRAAIKTQRA